MAQLEKGYEVNVRKCEKDLGEEGCMGGWQSIGQQKENNFGGFFTASIYHFLH